MNGARRRGKLISKAFQIFRVDVLKMIDAQCFMNSNPRIARSILATMGPKLATTVDQ